MYTCLQIFFVSQIKPMPKRQSLKNLPNLNDAVQSAANPNKAVEQQQDSATKAVPQQEKKPVVASTTKKPPSRVGTKAVTGHFDPAVSKQLKLLAINQDSTVQAMLAEALNDLFEKYGKPPIA